MSNHATIPKQRKSSNTNVSPIADAENSPLALSFHGKKKPFGHSHINSPMYDQIVKKLSSKINALKNNQMNIVDLEEKFYADIHELECKYMKLYEPFFKQRQLIVSGDHVVSGNEGVWQLDDLAENGEGSKGGDDSGNGQDVKELIKDMESKIDISSGAASMTEDFIGVPHFWLQVFKRTDLIMDMVQPQDEDVLLNLIDIKVIMKETKPYGYTLQFHFRPNEYFTNAILTKTYELTCDKDIMNPLTYDGPVMYKCQGCIIDWNKGKDITMQTIHKKQKHKSTGTVRTVIKEEKQDSFFNYFDTPTSDGLRPSFRASLPGHEDQECSDDEFGEDLCNADFEIGHFFKEFIVPKAVLYYTGEMVDIKNGEGEEGSIDGFFPQEDEDIDEESDESFADESMDEESK